MIRKNNAVWASTRDAASGTPNTGADVYADFYAGDSTYYIDRTFFVFDTSSVVGTITAVELYLKPTITGQTTDHTNAYASTQAGTSALTGTDFAACGTTAYANTGVVDSSATGGVYFSLTFNATGIAAINQAGYTKICMRDVEKDVGNSAPSSGFGATLYMNTPATAGSEPFLRITYTPPAAAATRRRALLGVGQ